MHPGSIPIYFLTHGSMLSKIAQQRKFRQAGTIIEACSRFLSSCANSVQPIIHDVLTLWPRQCARHACLHLLHFFKRQEVKFLAIGACIKYAFFSNIERSAIGFIYFLVRILFQQLSKKGWEVSIISASGMQVPSRTIFRAFPQSFVPIGFKWRHVTAGRNVETQSATQRIAFLAST